MTNSNIDYSLWDSIQNEYEQRIGNELFNFLLKDAKPTELNENQVIINVDNFIINFFKENTDNYKIFKNTCCKILYTNQLSLVFNAHNNNQENIQISNNSTSTFLNNYVEKNTLPNYNKFEETTFLTKKNTFDESYEKTNLQNHLNFNNFFYSYENQQVIKAAKLLIEETENPRFNPFFIYGASGIGKTHLLNAIGNEIFNLNLNKNILYLHSTNFIEEYTALFKGGINNTEKIEEFNEKYFNIDVLLVDDIQLLESKEGSLNGFFAIFEKLRNNNKIIIIASDKHPNKIHFEERLISRFLSGLNSELKLPDTDTKKQIFNYHAQKSDINITEEAINVFIDYSTNVRSLLGYLNSITIHLLSNDLENTIIDKDEAKKILNNTNGNQIKLNENDIIKIVIDYFKVSNTELMSKSRKKNIVDARHFCAYFLRHKLKFNHTKISFILNFNDHSAALNAIKAVEKKLKKEKYQNDLKKISQKIYD